MKIFSGNANKPLAEKISRHLGLELSPMEITVFADGEKRVKLNEVVVDQDSIVVQPTSTPPDQNYMELFLIIDALKRSGAKSVTAVVPYLGYQRQDHVFREGEDVSLEVIAGTLQRVGMDKLVVFDLHSIKIPELFTVPVVHLSALPLFADRIRNARNNSSSFLLVGETNSNDEIVLVSPDMGGIRRVKELSEMLNNLPFATVVKNRDLETGNISDTSLNGDVRGKIAIIVDDIISTGRTMVEAADILLENGAISVYAFATHPVLAANASETLQQSRIERVIVTDSIDIPEDKKFPKLDVISIASIAANALKD